ncbi:MAG: adenylate/guanylate cyclase domain-containing protein, partial [Candidatus Eremiobacteraeota bacterium]|nr:adenylate/guanylate cyclase domain-containing protein [Candidatus Eremiobacteraeota bacterium]
MKAVPSGTVTFAFTDIEGSTYRWEHNRAAMQLAVRRHDALVREAIVGHRGYVFKTVGDSFCAAFAHPADAAAAMLDVQRALSKEDFSALDGLRVRAAIHTGTADERAGDYFGPAVNRVARLLAIGHGGQILVSSVTSALVAGELPADATLRDLGEHALRDLEQRERVYQLEAPDLPKTFPPLRSLKRHASNLPPQLTSFVGREREMTEIAALVHAHRLVTLVGAGGVGKTRMAVQVATRLLDEFNDGVWFVDLASLSSGDHVPATIAHALGLKLPPSGNPAEHLVETLKAKKTLLIFDNCEHLIESVKRIATAILKDCPDAKILASSRQNLEVAGEQTYYLPSLETPIAVELFAERARSADDRFALTDENAAVLEDICRRLDGIPLAIELAASRANVLGVRQLSEKLNERFRLLTAKSGTRLPRQQTLRALIDWSFDLLDPDERALFARLSVFAGGWTLPAAAAVCADGALDEWQILDLLSALVSKSLVIADPSGDDRRYRMLNSIREYGREHLERGNGDAATTITRHAEYFANFARDLTPLINSLEDVRWRAQLTPELDNVRAAIDWTIIRENDV